jgi:PTH1 family peptidyl-tRNA hydrolase
MTVKVIVGLGNPGAEYERTPHNIGFLVVEDLAERLGCRLKTANRFEARLGSVRHGGEELLLVQPQTYMNSSGRTVGAILHFRKLAVSDLVVIVDDADMPLGQLRLRVRGGAGGHRGLESIAAVLGSGDYGRVRVGIGRGGESRALVRHVLEPFAADEWTVARKAIGEAAEAVLCMVEQGMAAAMNRFNVRREARRDGDDGRVGGEA